MFKICGYKYLQVIEDQLSVWLETFPISKADTGRVIKVLLKEIFPRYGIQKSEPEEDQVSQQEQSIDFIKG